jgi:predicted RNA methylase
MVGLIESLEGTVRKLAWKPAGTEWANYYEITNYSDAAFEHKKQLVTEWTQRVSPESVWDLGANTGVFSRLASANGIQTVAFDIDPAAVEFNYLRYRTKSQICCPWCST